MNTATTKEPDKIEDLLREVTKKLNVSEITDQDIKNKQSTLHHYIRDNVGRAGLNIPNDVEVPLEFIRANRPAIDELIKVRKRCVKCGGRDISTFDKCPYDEDKREKARKYEKEKGLDRGTITPTTLAFRNFYWRNKSAHGFRSLVRPTLMYRKGNFVLGYETCPIAPTKKDARENNY